MELLQKQQHSDNNCVICFGEVKRKNIATSADELNKVFNNCVTLLENVIVIEPFENEAGLIFCDLCLDFESHHVKFTEHISSLQKKVLNLTIAFSAGVVHRRNKFFEGKKETDVVAETTGVRQIHISESNDEPILLSHPSPNTTGDIENVQEVSESPSAQSAQSADNPLSESLNEVVNERQSFGNAIGEANPDNIENNLADPNVESSKNKYVNSELMQTAKTQHILLKRISLDTTKRPEESDCGNSCENNSPLKKNDTENYCHQPNARPRRSKYRGIQLHQKPVFKCSKCQNTFPFQNVLNSHLKMHCKQKTRQQCATTKRTVQKNHKKMNPKVGMKKLPCSFCQKLFTPYYLPQHEKYHTGEAQYNCEICDKMFVSSNILNTHKISHSNVKAYKCQTCKKSFLSKNTLKAHKVIHSNVRAYICETCQKTFLRKGDLKIHEVVHTNVRAFKCEVCDMAFRQKSNLNSHAVIHTEGREQKCSFCHKIYCTASYLKRHEKIHRGGSEYKCEFCKKSFSYFQQLDRHTRSHTREKPYKCSFCEKTFSNGSAMKSHERIHSGQYRYECSFCKKGFNFRTNFESHVRRHVGECPYICLVCKKEFFQLGQLKKHEKIHATETQGNTF